MKRRIHIHLRLIQQLLIAFVFLYCFHLIALLSYEPPYESTSCFHHRLSISGADIIKPIKESTVKEETAAICVIVKDEQLYLEEWVLYNLGISFDHIYMYDNSPLQTTAAWRQKDTAKIKDRTTVVPFLNESDTRQYDAYRDCMKNYGKRHTWIAIIDVDEFIVLYKHDTILSLLKQHCKRGSLAIHWLVMGTSGHFTFEPDPVTKRFQHATNEHRNSFKSIIRVKDYKNITYNHHWVELKDNKWRHDTSGDWVQMRQLWSDKSKFSSKRKRTGEKEFPLDVAAVYHYKYKSVEEYRSKLCRRGDVLDLDLCTTESHKSLPTGDMTKVNERAYQLLKRNVPKYEQPMMGFQAINDDRVDPSTIFVISMQGTSGVDKRNKGRLDSFKEKWQKVCGTSSSIRIEHCPGVFEPRRGYGLTLSWLLCLEMAKDLDLEITVVFEDDARLFDRARDFCDVDKREEKYWLGLPSDTFIAFLGGHNWEYPPNKDLNNMIISGYRELSFSYGTYGFVVPRYSMKHLLDSIKDDIVHGFRNEENIHQHHKFLSPEKSWYRAAKKFKKKIYVTKPLVVWHEGGFSNTWKADRDSITGEETDTLVGNVRGVFQKKDRLVGGAGLLKAGLDASRGNSDSAFPMISQAATNDHHANDETGSFANCTHHIVDTQKTHHPDQKSITISCHTFPYRVPSSTTFKEKIVIGVISAASGDGPSRRQAIRQSWGRGHSVFFIVAGPWANILEEYNSYRDLIWLNRDEVYEGENSVLSFKTMALMVTVYDISTSQKLDIEYAFKTDDDSFINVDSLHEHLLQTEKRHVGTSAHYDYWGICKKEKIEPLRNARKFKWAVSRQLYPEQYYPIYCQGVGFAMSFKFLSCSASSGAVMNHNIASLRFMPLEDVAVGLLAERCAIMPSTLDKPRLFKQYRTNLSDERHRIRNGLPKIGKERLSMPDMEGRVVQHRIYDAWDMMQHLQQLNDPDGFKETTQFHWFVPGKNELAPVEK